MVDFRGTVMKYIIRNRKSMEILEHVYIMLTVLCCPIKEEGTKETIAGNQCGQDATIALIFDQVIKNLPADSLI